MLFKIFYFFLFPPLQNGKEAIKNIAVLFKDVHGVAFTVIWIAAATIHEKKKKIYDTEIMMLITGTLGLCGEPTKFYAYYIFALL